MPKPEIHSQIDANKFGGNISDYVAIHNIFDSSKQILPDSRHRALLHHSFGIFLIEKIFGIDFDKLEKLRKKYNWSEEEVQDILQWKDDCINNGTSIKNSDNKKVQIRDVGESHCLVDFGQKFIPTFQDYIENCPLEDWMNNGKGYPPSHKKVYEKRKVKCD